MDNKALQNILDKHKLWLGDARLGVCANLHSADLYGADLYGANLRGADLRGADLGYANLHSANLQGANLYGANLRGAKLYNEDGTLNNTITKTWKDSFKDAVHFYSVFRKL